MEPNSCSRRSSTVHWASDDDPKLCEVACEWRCGRILKDPESAPFDRFSIRRPICAELLRKTYGNNQSRRPFNQSSCHAYNRQSPYLGLGPIYHPRSFRGHERARASLRPRSGVFLEMQLNPLVCSVPERIFGSEACPISVKRLVVVAPETVDDRPRRIVCVNIKYVCPLRHIAKYTPNSFAIRKLDYLNSWTGFGGERPIYLVPLLSNTRSPAVFSIHLVSSYSPCQLHLRSGHTRGTHRES
jgi:hypothetical protein